MNTHTPKIIVMVSLALLISASIASTHAQSARALPLPTQGVAQTNRSTEEALLNEVRLIRETLQRAQDSTQRDRMVVERMRMHDERVERLGRQIAEVRDEIGGIELHVSQMNEREASLEAQIEKSKDPNQRQALESERKELRFTQDAQTQRLQRLRDRESALASQLQKEESALRSLEARLDALDRELEAAARRTAGSKPIGGR
jgi:predicted  nucleic acid-binding Zn-ribbon protein